MAIPIIQRTKILEQVVDILKDLILKGNYKIGDYLPSEIELCRQMGIGRSTLREAIKILESYGLVEKTHGVGVIVVDESFKATSGMFRLTLIRKGYTMKELFEFRSTNEIRTAELASLYATKSNLQEIEKYLQIMRNNMASESEYLNADIEFHLAIAKASQNKLYMMILQIVRPLLEEMIQTTMMYHHRPEQNFNFHENIFKAIKNGDTSLSITAMKKHLEGTASMLGISQKLKK